jgi:21S rRNA (GM2251-2'-O)-methyltransferase
LRCGSLSFEHLLRIPDSPKLWLALEEVVDPQHLGALLRSAYFLSNTGVIVCATNSAPPSPVVSAASAGALELANVWSTSNLPRTLLKAQEDGFRIVGASSVPIGEGTFLYELNELPKDDRPTILILGSEGSGLRTLVAKACTEFVRIPGGSSCEPKDEEDASGVDSVHVVVATVLLLDYPFIFPTLTSYDYIFTAKCAIAFLTSTKVINYTMYSFLATMQSVLIQFHSHCSYARYVHVTTDLIRPLEANLFM